MQPFHPLAADANAAPEEIAAAQAHCALALGRLDGLLVGLDEDEKRLFCYALLRSVLLCALTQAGFSDAEMRFDAWFAGLDRAPQSTPLTPCPAHTVVRAVLTELGHHPWAPLAEAAQTIAAAARFSADLPVTPDDDFAGEAISRARGLVSQAGAVGACPLPFASLSRLHDLLRQDPVFAPAERGMRTYSIAGREVTIEHAAPRTPLWAVDVSLGLLLASCGTWRLALPCPAAVTAESLQPHLWPGEQAILAATALHAAIAQLTELVSDARKRAALMHESLGHLRSRARGPLVWIVLAAFAPLGLDQITSAFGVSRRGTYAIGDALVAAGMARRATIKGRVLLVAVEPRGQAQVVSTLQGVPSPSAALAQFDTAMADIDRLLANRVIGG